MAGSDAEEERPEVAPSFRIPAHAHYGTDLFRYDYGSDTIKSTHNKWHDTVIAFLPDDPSWIYLGLSIEPIGGGAPHGPT